MRGMNIRERVENGILVLEVEGRLDHEGAEIFRQEASRLISAGHRCILVDFGGTTFLASMGIRALILPSQEVAQQGGKLAVTGLSGELKKLFDTAGLHQLFTVFPTLAEAIASDAWPKAV
jgi:anti-anti-sigma factor